MKTSTATQLPTFTTKLFHIDEPAGSYDMLEVECPRAGCHGKFWVRPAAWRHRVGVISGACPYCFKAAQVPGVTNQRKIVKRRRSK